MAALIITSYFKSLKLIHLIVVLWNFRLYIWCFQHRAIIKLEPLRWETRRIWFDTGTCVICCIIHINVIQQMYKRYAFQLILVNSVVMLVAGYYRITGFETIEASTSHVFVDRFLNGIFVCIMLSMTFFFLKFDNHNNYEVFLFTKEYEKINQTSKSNKKFQQVFTNLEQGILLLEKNKTMLKNSVLDKIIT